MFSLLKNEKGFGSLVLVLGVTSVASLMIIQLSVSFQANRNLHRKVAQKSRTHRHLQGLAQKVKRSFDMAQIDPTCASIGPNFQPVTLTGSTAANPKILCIHQSNGLCITDEAMLGGPTPICVNTSVRAFNWQAPTTGTGSGGGGTPISYGTISGSPPIGATFGAASRRNRIVIPNVANNIWKACAAPANCIRLEMCPIGQRNCTNAADIVTQVIRLGL